MEILSEHWAELALALIVVADIIVSATPTKKDDQFLGYISLIVNALSGAKKKRNKQ